MCVTGAALRQVPQVDHLHHGQRRGRDLTLTLTLTLTLALTLTFTMVSVEARA